MSSTQPLPRVALPRPLAPARTPLKQTGKMPRLELEALLREVREVRRDATGADCDALASAVEPPAESVAFPLVTRKS